MYLLFIASQSYGAVHLMNLLLDFALRILYSCRMLNEEFIIDLPENELDAILASVATPPPATIKRPRDYPQNFCMELALGLEDEEVLCIRYDLTPYEYECLKENHAFQKDLASWRSRMAEDGLSFKLKARVQAESYLQEIDSIITSIDTSAETKLNAITRCVEWAGLGPKQQDGKNSGTSVTINITRFSEDSPKTIEI